MTNDGRNFSNSNDNSVRTSLGVALFSSFLILSGFGISVGTNIYLLVQTWQLEATLETSMEQTRSAINVAIRFRSALEELWEKCTVPENKPD